MRIEIDFLGIQDLVSAFEKAASDAEIKEVNKSIVEKSKQSIKKIMSKKMPKSADICKSGRGFGTQTSVSAHAADVIPVGKEKVKGTVVSANVGWEKADNSEHFYVKFINWGTIYQPPKNFVFATVAEAEDEVRRYAEQEYQEFLNNTVR